MRFMLTFMMVSLATSAAHAGDSGSPGRADSFAQGSWTATTYGSATFGADNRGNIYLAHAGVGYFVWDGVALHLEGVVGHTDAKQRFVPDSNTYGFDLLARWHFWHDET